MATEVLPTELKLEVPPTMPQARSYMFSQQATNQNFKSSDVIQIDIPRLQRSYLTKESYLKLNVLVYYNPDAVDDDLALTDNQYRYALCLDTPGAFSFIDSIEVYDYLGSTLLERTSGIAQLKALFNDVDGITGIDAAEGTRQGYVTAGGDANSYLGFGENVSDVARLKTIANGRLSGPVSGDILYPVDYTVGDPMTPVYKEFSLPLLSFLGTFSTKFAPLHNGFTIMIHLNNDNTVFGITNTSDSAIPTGTIYDSGRGYTIQSASLQCQVLELSPHAEALLLESTNGEPMTLHSRAYRNYSKALIPPGTGTTQFEQRWDLGLNVASLTGLLWIMRDQRNLNDMRQRSISHRNRNYLSNWKFLYGSSTLPSPAGISTRYSSNKTQDGGGTDAFCELLKARRVYNNSKSLIHKDDWNIDALTPTYMRLSPFNLTFDNVKTDYTTNTFPVGRFACGLNTELFPERSGDLISGLNTNGMNTTIVAAFDPYTNGEYSPVDAKQDTMEDGVVKSVVDIWAEYDAFIGVVPGIATTVNF